MPVQYRYGYDVADSLTGDYKSQQEQRDGDVVQGSYSVVEPDGTRRIVDYAADPVNGFNAVVRKEPLVRIATTPVAASPVSAVPQPAVVAARYTYGSPAPAVYTAPAAPVYGTPVATAYSPFGIPAAAYALSNDRSIRFALGPSGVLPLISLDPSQAATFKTTLNR